MDDDKNGTQDDAQDGTEGQTEGGTGQTETDGDASALGEAGKRALDSMKDKWRTERDLRKAQDARIAELEAKQSKPEGQDDKPDVDAIRREATSAATKAANARIVKAEIKAAAAGKLADPADALTMLDLSKFDVDSDGNVDAEDITDAIDRLLQAKPYLSAQGGKRFQGSADGGARKPNREGVQLTREDLKTMSPAAIVEARKAGRCSDLGYK